jgi:hypothetical protein
MSPGIQNMRTGLDTLRTVENMSGSGKHENGIKCLLYRRKRVWARKTLKRDPTPSESLKMSPSAQNIKMGPNALATAENESWHAKHENGS